METHREGLSAQIMHVDPPSRRNGDACAATGEFLPAHHLIPNGHHHQIYLNNPNRVAPEKLKTVLRQPVRSAG
jgi:hypothetical protein